MKKLLLMLIVAVFATSSINAQKKFTFGPKLGLNISSINYSSGGYEGEDGIRPAFVIGAFGEYRFNKWVSVSADLLYSQQGASYNYKLANMGVETIDRDVVMALDYINVPILANFYIVKGLSIKAGIQPGFLVSATKKVTNNLTNTKESNDIKSQCNSVDVAIPVGASYSFNCGLILDARYNIALSNISKNEEGVTTKNSVFAITVGWKF